jgi:exodeoxyribonuclease VII large subunit
VREAPRVYRVAELNRRVRARIEQWGEVWVEGEVSDAQRAASGHVYFTLSDSTEPAQIRIVMFRGDARFARAKLVDGERVRVLGRLSLFEPRGTFQLIARIAQPAGEGDRRAEIERLKKKLAAEGLLAPQRKRVLPQFPQAIGIVTSRDGAALFDIVRVASQRAPLRLVLAHCTVQGPDASPSIVRAIERIARVRGIEVVIVARGGGAAEDLSAFNDEAVARAVAACPVPVVSGVGHELDETIVDLVADVRAATPSNAAEIVVPDGVALASELAHVRRRLERAFETSVGRARLRLERLERQLRDPRHMSALARERLRRSQQRLERAMARAIASMRARSSAIERRLVALDPRLGLERGRAQLQELDARLRAFELPRGAITELQERLRDVMSPRLTHERGRIAQIAAKLSALSPLNILARGYAIALHDGAALTRAADARPGDSIAVRLHEGTLHANVTEVE